MTGFCRWFDKTEKEGTNMAFKIETKVTLTCGGCGSKVENAEFGKVTRCLGCEGLIGLVTRGQLLPHVHLNKDMLDMDIRDAQYFDFDIILNPMVASVKGVGPTDRIHGWFDPTTKRVTQYG